MSAFEEHCQDCARLLSDRCEEVNHWIDGMFKRLGPMHRFVRHHTLGVEEAEKLFGEIGRKAAIVHILKDCGRIPTARDWEERKVDTLGIDPTGKFNGYWDARDFVEAAKKLLTTLK